MQLVLCNSAKALEKKTSEEKAYREFMIDMARNEKSAYSAYHKFFDKKQELVAPDFSVLEGYFDEEDACDAKIKALYEKLSLAKKDKDKALVSELKEEIKAQQKKRETARKNSKIETDKHAFYNRAVKPYLEAKKVIAQRENYGRFDEILEGYEDARLRAEAEEQRRIEEEKLREAEKKAYEEQLMAEKLQKKKEKAISKGKK